MQLIWQLFDGSRQDFPLEVLSDLEKVHSKLLVELKHQSNFVNQYTILNFIHVNSCLQSAPYIGCCLIPSTQL